MTEFVPILKNLPVEFFGKILEMVNTSRAKEYAKLESEEKVGQDSMKKFYEIGLCMGLTLASDLARELNLYDYPLAVNSEELADLCLQITLRAEQANLRMMLKIAKENA